MNYWKVILATMVIFGAGVLTGGLVVRFVPAYAPQPQRAGNGPRFGEFGSPGGMRLEFLRRTQKELELTAQQREQIDKLMRQSQERTRKLMEPVAPQLHQELQRAKAEFREVLTPEQQTRFDQLLKQQQRFREHHGTNRFESGVTNTPATNSI